MELAKQFLENIRRKNLFSKSDRLIVALSGGLDSIVLAKLCMDGGFNIELAHCNFQLRGMESERDEAFVKEMAAKWNVPLHLKRFDTGEYAQKEKIAIQEAARKLRYEWFEALLDGSRGSRAFLLTAHHADDNREWLLMNFCRGTGLDGLKGMPEKRAFIRRPLLIFEKSELEGYATVNDLHFVEDSSNNDSKYTRNLFRNEIMPLIRKAYPSLGKNLDDNIGRFTEINGLYRLMLEPFLKKLCKRKGEELHIPVKQLLAFQNKALVYEIIQPFGFSDKQVEMVIHLAAESQTGSYLETDSHRIIRHRHWLIIAPGKGAGDGMQIIEAPGKTISFHGGSLKIEEVNLKNGQDLQNSDHNLALVNSKELKFPLVLRKWKTGDYFYPLGMRKKKKLARFFIDAKLSRTDKEKIWVLESSQRICWVIGMRIDDRFRIEETNQRAVRIQFEKN